MNKWIAVVSGLPRSGTSMMMQMLDAGGLSALTDNVRAADEDNPRGYYEFEAVKRLPDDAGWVADAEGKVVKMVYRLLYALPADHNYRVVFMRRALQEVIASQEVMLRRSGSPADDVPPDKLAEIYRKQLEDVEQWLADQPNFRTLYVDYHDVLERPATVAEALNDFLGGELDVVAMGAVPDRALYRKRA